MTNQTWPEIEDLYNDIVSAAVIRQKENVTDDKYFDEIVADTKDGAEDVAKNIQKRLHWMFTVLEKKEIYERDELFCRTELDYEEEFKAEFKKWKFNCECVQDFVKKYLAP